MNIKPKMEEIKKVVAKYFDITVADVESPCRAAGFVRPRQISMYLCRELTGWSYPMIARFHGRRDHTTVMYGYGKIKDELTTDQELAQDVAAIKAALEDARTPELA